MQTNIMKNGDQFNKVSFFNLEYLKYLYFCSEGRINRKKYLAGGFFLGFFSYCVAFALISLLNINATAPSNDMSNLPTSAGAIVVYCTFAILYIFLIISSILMQIKRLHDLDKSGWFCLLMLVPLVNFLLAIYLIFFRGTEGNNRFGADPVD